MYGRASLFLTIFSILFLGSQCLDGEVIEEIDDGHSSSGTILRKQDGRTQSSSSGGVFFVTRSHRPRASAVRTFHDQYVGGDRTPRLRNIDTETGGFEHDLHMAYRLPLQRLSDQQLHLLLAKYSPETNQESRQQMDRVDMINKVQEKIVQNSQTKLIRPTLLTNINMVPEEITIDSEPAADPRSHQRTTLSSVHGTTPVPVFIRKPEIRRSQKQIPELEPTDQSNTETPRTSHELKEINKVLRQVKMRYDTAKLEYLRRLRELNERKITLAVPKKVEPKKLNKISAKKVISTVDNEPQPEEIKKKETGTSHGFSMVETLKHIIATVKAKKDKIFLHEGGSDGVARSESELPVNFTPPRASPIPKIFSVNTEHVKKEKPRPSPEVVNPKLHSGGNDHEEEISVSTTPTSEYHSQDSVQKSFSFNMKKVSDISTSELIEQLSEELRSAPATTTSTTPSTTTSTTEEPTTTEANEEEEFEGTIVSSDEEDLAAFASESREEAICDAISCNFEKGDLCQWEASTDEISPGSPLYRRRLRQARYVQRTWHNWQGRYRNRVTGIARAQVFSFDNQKFAAAYVRPFQRATLTGRLLSGEQETIRFRAWEATRNVQLRVCCDNTENCVFETEIGVFRGSRQWKEHTATCPAGTSKVIFECINHGIYQGACGLDNIHLMNFYCPQVIPLVSIIDNEEK